MRIASIVVAACFAAGAFGQDCPLGDPGPKGPITPREETQRKRSCLEWTDIGRVTKPTPTGDAADPEPARPTRPLMVYVHDPVDKTAYLGVETPMAWYDWQVVVPARLFTRLRIPLEQARRDPALRRHARNRRVLFLRPDLRVVTALPARSSVSKLYGAMAKTAALDFEPPVPEIWREWQEIQAGIQDAKKKMRALNDLAREAARTRDPKKREALSKKRHARMAEQSERIREFEAREKALYILRVKDTGSDS